MFVEENIRRAIVSVLAFHGKTIGFFILENPNEETIEDRDLLMPGMRYILSSLVYSDHLVRRLKRIGYVDTLTGVGNRVSLQEYLSRLRPDKSISVLYCDVIGWDNGEGKPQHMENEQTLLRTAEILANVFDEEHVFRVATGEFLIVEEGMTESELDKNLLIVKGLLQEHNLLTAIAFAWKEVLDQPVDALIHEVHREVVQERRLVIEHRGAHHQVTLPAAERMDHADISLPKGNVFFRKADTFLAGFFEESVAVIAIDINYFKLYNDIFGRKAGNIFLENIAEVLEHYKIVQV